jgi:hypothetical protein
VRHKFDALDLDEALATVKYQQAAYAAWDSYFFAKETDYVEGTLTCFCDEQF